MSDGSVACWGNNDYGGQATPPTGSFVSVSAGDSHTCGVRSNGSVACWGRNDFGQATPPAGLFNSVSAGVAHTCGVRSNGSVACWGNNWAGQATPPTGSFVSVSAGDSHTCGVRSDGSVACWGNDGGGQATPPAGSFVSVSAGRYHTCGVMSDGSVTCWGWDGNGESTPPAGSFASVSAGEDYTCGAMSDGAVVCWGSDEYGQATPPAGSFVSVSARYRHTCGVGSNGAVACWGSNYYGQASPPTGSFSPTPSAAEVTPAPTPEREPTTPTATPTSAPTPTPAPAAMPLSWDEYLKHCAPLSWELSYDATNGDFSSLFAAEADRLAALAPPAQLSEWHLLNIENYRTLQVLIDMQPKDDVVDSATLVPIVFASLAEFREKLGESAVRLPVDVRQQMIEAGCIDPADLPSVIADGSDDHGNAIDGATSAAVGVDVEGVIDYEGDSDYFRFTAEEGRLYQIDVTLGTLPDSYLSLYVEMVGPETWGVEANDDYEDSVASRIIWEAPESGNYYIRVNGGVRYDQVGSYTLTVSIIDDHSNTPNNAANSGNTSYDTDGDGLIEVANLEQLNAIRWDLDGDGLPDSSSGMVGFAAAFPGALDGMGCPDSKCSGYELISDLDFDTNGNGRADAGDDYWNDGEGWAPIGDDFEADFESSFNGGGYTISNLYIDRSDAQYVGLFGKTSWNGWNVWVGLNNNIRDLALVNVDVQGGTETGGLAGFNGLVIAACSVTGVVRGSHDVGGLVGDNFSGTVIASYSAASVADGLNTGGLVGSNFSGTIIASYSIGSVSDYKGASSFADVGGLVGSNFADRGTTRDSYWDTQTSGQSESAGGEGKTTSELQSPTGYTGIYENWNLDLDDDGVGDDLWDFGDASQYPRLRHGS